MTIFYKINLKGIFLVMGLLTSYGRAEDAILGHKNHFDKSDEKNSEIKVNHDDHAKVDQNKIDIHKAGSLSQHLETSHDTNDKKNQSHAEKDAHIKRKAEELKNKDEQKKKEDRKKIMEALSWTKRLHDMPD